MLKVVHHLAFSFLVAVANFPQNTVYLDSDYIPKHEFLDFLRQGRILLLSYHHLYQNLHHTKIHKHLYREWLGQGECLMDDLKVVKANCVLIYHGFDFDAEVFERLELKIHVASQNSLL